MKRISIFVSGNGTNLQRIAEYFKDSNDVEIVNVVCNNPKAYAIERAKNLGIPLRMVTKTEFNSLEFTQEMAALKLDLIVLAGFLWKIPASLIQAYPKRIINIPLPCCQNTEAKAFTASMCMRPWWRQKKPSQASPSIT